MNPNEVRTININIKSLKVNAPCPHCRKTKLVHFLYEPATEALKDLERKKLIKLSDTPFSFQNSPKYYCFACQKPVFDDSNICPICWNRIEDKVTRMCYCCGWKRDIYQETNLQETWGNNVISYEHYQDNWLMLLSLKVGDSIGIYPLDYANAYYEGVYLTCLKVNESVNRTAAVVIKKIDGQEEIIPIWRIQAIKRVKPLPISKEEIAPYLSSIDLFPKKRILPQVFSSK